MSIIKHVTLQKIVAHDFRYDDRIIFLVPGAARSEAWVCGRSPVGIAGSNLARGMDVLSLLSVVGCQVEVSASG